IDNTALADLMAEAGLTHGGFYKHFESKEQVAIEALQLALDDMRESLAKKMEHAPGNQSFTAAFADYLSPEHRDDQSGGCFFVALASELARGSDQMRDKATAGMVSLIDLIASHLTELPPAAAKKKALVIVSTMIGALTVARMVNDEKLSASILREARKALLQ
ncbi:TetR/AcrR family transcriptional regulator, partial [Paraburkholderia jirisanensis]